MWTFIHCCVREFVTTRSHTTCTKELLNAWVNDYLHRINMSHQDASSLTVRMDGEISRICDRLMQGGDDDNVEPAVWVVDGHHNSNNGDFFTVTSKDLNDRDDYFNYVNNIALTGQHKMKTLVLPEIELLTFYDMTYYNRKWQHDALSHATHATHATHAKRTTQHVVDDAKRPCAVK